MQSHKIGFVLACSLTLALDASGLKAEGLDERPQARFGQAITDADIELWDIDIQSPTGKGLPPGEGTAVTGKTVYEMRCLACHGEKAAGGPVFGTMVGGIGSMDKNPRILTPGSMYPYAPILFDYVRRSMPMDSPQSLTADEVYAVSAYIYHLNGLVDEKFKMTAESMAKIRMPNRDNFIEDDRPDTKALRCMSNCKPIGTVGDARKN